MDQFDVLRSLLTPLDMMALALYFVSMIAYRTFTDRVPSMRSRNLVGAVQRQRDMWMRNMSRRDNRNMDIILLGNGRSGERLLRLHDRDRHRRYRGAHGIGRTRAVAARKIAVGCQVQSRIVGV